MLDYFKIGHYTDKEHATGVTVILPKKDAIAGCCCRGYSPATRETDLLKDDKTVQKVNAIVLSGGSAFGLEADCGVVDFLKEQNIGYDTGKFRVPIVCGASIYDLEYKDFAYPDKKAGYEACLNAKENYFISDNIGGASGSTIGKILGMDYSIKTKLGVSTFTLNGIEIAVITLVNAIGDIVKNGEIIAGPKTEDGEYLDCKKVFTLGTVPVKKTNTTIGCIITNAKITKQQANILCSIAHDGYATSLSPSHTLFDGDCMFLMSSCEKEIPFNSLTAIIPDLTARSIQSSVTGIHESNNKVNGLVLKVAKKFL